MCSKDLGVAGTIGGLALMTAATVIAGPVGLGLCVAAGLYQAAEDKKNGCG